MAEWKHIKQFTKIKTLNPDHQHDTGGPLKYSRIALADVKAKTSSTRAWVLILSVCVSVFRLWSLSLTRTSWAPAQLPERLSEYLAPLFKRPWEVNYHKKILLTSDITVSLSKGPAPLKSDSIVIYRAIGCSHSNGFNITINLFKIYSILTEL